MDELLASNGEVDGFDAVCGVLLLGVAIDDVNGFVFQIC